MVDGERRDAVVGPRCVFQLVSAASVARRRVPVGPASRAAPRADRWRRRKDVARRARRASALPLRCLAPQHVSRQFMEGLLGMYYGRRRHRAAAYCLLTLQLADKRLPTPSLRRHHTARHCGRETRCHSLFIYPSLPNFLHHSPPPPFFFSSPPMLRESAIRLNIAAPYSSF
ncbi:hypothetical protein MRX96_012155 [Rhipicephalus microplus]